MKYIIENRSKEIGDPYAFELVGRVLLRKEIKHGRFVVFTLGFPGVTDDKEIKVAVSEVVNKASRRFVVYDV